MLGFTKALLIAAVAAQAVFAAPVDSNNDSDLKKEFHVIRSLGNSQFRDIFRCTHFHEKFFTDIQPYHVCTRMQPASNDAQICEYEADWSQNNAVIALVDELIVACTNNGGVAYDPRTRDNNNHIFRQPVVLADTNNNSHTLLRCENARSDLIFFYFGVVNSYCKVLESQNEKKYTCTIDPNDADFSTHEQEFREACEKSKGYIVGVNN
ncbi:hypothetical protein ACQY0O_005474 [Thecaphora frezii]